MRRSSAHPLSALGSNVVILQEPSAGRRRPLCRRFGSARLDAFLLADLDAGLLTDLLADLACDALHPHGFAALHHLLEPQQACPIQLHGYGGIALHAGLPILLGLPTDAQACQGISPLPEHQLILIVTSAPHRYTHESVEAERGEIGVRVVAYGELIA